MGMRAYVHRSDYDSNANRFHGLSAIVVVNVDGPFEPTTVQEAALVVTGPGGNKIVVPAVPLRDGWEVVRQTRDCVGPMMGGTFAAASDSRWVKACGRAALPIHDRYETWETYETLSR